MAGLSWLGGWLWWLFQLPWYVLVGYRGTFYAFSEDEEKDFADAYAMDPGGGFCIYVPRGGIFRRGWVRPGSTGDRRRRLYIERRWHMSVTDFFVSDSEGSRRRVHFRPTRMLLGWIQDGEPSDMRLSAYIVALEKDNTALHDDIGRLREERADLRQRIAILEKTIERNDLRSKIDRAIDSGDEGADGGDGMPPAKEVFRRLQAATKHLPGIISLLQEGIRLWHERTRRGNPRIPAALRQAQLMLSKLVPDKELRDELFSEEMEGSTDIG
ncbi:hypothetical protein FJZ48_02815 [Candidatus Uhrbacteria bacterium]|nr:hypothetical protein [Candidatus Uhrbacteria bacterium]